MPIDRLDTLRANQREQRGSAELFARLLERHAEGHALFHPRMAGSIGDCGYIENGTFTKLFNACDPPAGIDQFGSLDGVCEEDVRDNSRHLLQSSISRTVTFKASIADNCLPAGTHPVEITPEITRSSDDFAFLAFAGSERVVETLIIPARTRLWSWLVHNSVRILDFYAMSTMQVIYKTVKSAGWVGGVAHRQSSATAGRITGRISHLFRANVALENTSNIDTGLIDTRGPPRGTSWSQNAPSSYTVVVKCLQITLTDKWLFKLGMRVPAAADASKGRSAGGQMGTSERQPSASISVETVLVSGPQDASSPQDDLGPDHTPLSAIMRRAGQNAQDDEVIVIASAEIIQDYLKRYQSDPDPATVRYEVERVPISDGMFAIHIPVLDGPGMVVEPPQTSADTNLATPSEGGIRPHHSYGPQPIQSSLGTMNRNQALTPSTPARQADEGELLSKRSPAVAVRVAGELRPVQKELFMKELQAARKVALRPFSGTVDSSGQFSAVSTYTRNGNLMDYIKAHPSCDRKKLILQVAGAVNYLHNTALIVHGNICCENVLISDSGDALLSDLGLNASMASKDDVREPIIGMRETPRFLAPELLAVEDSMARIRSRTRESDVYAFGILILEAATAKEREGDSFGVSVRDGPASQDHPPRPMDGQRVSLSHAVWDLCCSCWQVEPSLRPNIHDVQQSLISINIEPVRVVNQDHIPVAYMEDGGTIVSACMDGIMTTDVRTGQSVTTPVAADNINIYLVTVSTHGSQIATCTADKIYLWDVRSGGFRTLTDHEGLECIALSRDDTRIAAGADDKTIHVWDVTTGRLIAGPMKGHTGTVNDVAFSPDGFCLASVSADTTLRLWHIETGASLATLDCASQAYDVCFSPDGLRLAAATKKTVLIWDLPTRRLELSLETDGIFIGALAFSPSSRYIACGWDKTVRILDAHTGAFVVPALEGHGEDVLSLAFSPDGRSLVSGSDETTRIWDLFK